MPILPLLIGLEISVLIGFVLYGMLHSLVSWLRSWLGQVFTATPASRAASIFPGRWKYLDISYDIGLGLGFAAKAIVWPLKTALAHVEHKVASAIGHGLEPNLQRMTRLFHGADAVLAQQALHIKGLALGTYQALSHLRHVTVPRLITEAVAPVRAIAVDARSLALDAEGRFNVFRDALLTALAAVGIGTFTTAAQGINALVHTLDRLHDKVWSDIVPKVETLVGLTIPAIVAQEQIFINDLYNTGIDSLEGIRVRLRNLEDIVGNSAVAFRNAIIAALGTAAGLLALEGILTRIAPDLFCRNTKGVTKKLCGLDTALLDSILGLSLAFLVVLDPVEIAKAALVVEGEMESVIHRVAA